MLLLCYWQCGMFPLCEKIAFLPSTNIFQCEYIKSSYDKNEHLFLTNSKLKFSNVNSQNSVFNIWVSLCDGTLVTKTYL